MSTGGILSEILILDSSCHLVSKPCQTWSRNILFFFDVPTQYVAALIRCYWTEEVWSLSLVCHYIIRCKVLGCVQTIKYSRRAIFSMGANGLDASSSSWKIYVVANRRSIGKWM